MQFAVETLHRGDYSTKTKVHYVKKDKFVDGLMRFRKYSYGAITTKIDKGWFVKHILALDLDYVDNMLAATHWVATELAAGYAIIESSHDRFWLVVDIVDKWPLIKYHLESIPGVDEQFILLCRHLKTVLLRAVPRIRTTNGESYTGHQGTNRDVIEWRQRYKKAPTISDPKFPTEHTLTNPDAVAWYDGFKAWYEGTEYATLKKSFVLRHAAWNHKVGELAQNPGFLL